ncbi:MAG TPA: UDP-N-acetylglucosamine 2-epimerase (non-hydrolyzing) [bacterium]|nr:UDP-N-acetylglucosamine 2-epimerase (non-hydrolyzing) [bacterium]
MKILTILGTRPEIIRLCLIIKKLDKACEQVLVHTGQNYDINLNDIFLEQLGVRKMDYYLGAEGTPAGQIGKILVGLEKIIDKEKPDRFLVLGDTNSSMGAIVAKRMAVPVYHMEAGNRCYDDRVPEEVNRRIIDHSSDVLMPYTERSRQNLLREGIEGERIYVTGNPIKEVLDNFREEIGNSEIIKKLKIEPKKYFLATLHRQENVDDPKRLKIFVEAYSKLTATYKMPLIWSVHPRTRSRLKTNGITPASSIKTVEPLGLFNFVNLEKNAYCVLSDSGTVQEECAIFGVANVTTRDTTERPETIEVGSNFLSGCNVKTILTGVKLATGQKGNWQAPKEYLAENVSDTVLRILLSYRP